MAYDESRPDDARRPRFDDDEYPSIEKPPSSARGVLIVLGVLGVCLVLVLCLVGAVVFVRLSSSDAIAAKAEGTWKCRWTVHNMELESLYTFRRDGTFREESFDMQGNRINIADARWRVRNDGQIEINWQGGGLEIATVRFRDDNTMEYRITEHNDVTQINLTTVFRRQ
jgi:hypothetical protein